MGKFYSMLIILERKWYIIVLVPIENNAISRFYFTQLVHPGQGPAYSTLFFLCEVSPILLQVN